MESEPHKPNRTRENVIVLTMTLFIGGLLVFFLDIISLGIMKFALGIGLAVVLLGCFHYLLWGRALTEEVSAERALAMQEEQDAAEEHAEGIQDLTRRRGIKRARTGK